MYQSNEIGELAAALAAAQSEFTFAVTDAPHKMALCYEQRWLTNQGNGWHLKYRFQTTEWEVFRGWVAR